LAQRAFGVVSVSPARLVPADLAGLCREAVVLALSRPWASFAIRPTREGTHPFTSHDVAVEAGQAVLDAARKAGRAARVDLDRPDLELGVDVRGERAYLFLERLPGSGGLPVGSQGTALCLLSDEASFVAAWLMMRRGCAVVTLHAGDTGSVPVEAVEALGRWGLPRDIEVLPVCTGTVTKANLLEAAARVAAERGAIALVTGETLDAMPLAVPAAPMPVLRPVCGLDPEEYARLRNRIGLPAIEAKKVLDPRGRDTVESMLRLRRRVSA
ncbi:MAG TPA: THUMP domain-containing protein, partial [Candidatus Thermoplasmatota archaeon]|nr:THUMP domain-containing protein [Candidatus Thermoplasmatota archaeon]